MLKKLSEKMKGSAVMKQIGANAGQIKKVLQKDELPKIEGFLKEEKLMKVGKDVEDVAEHAQKVMDTDGPAIGQLYEDAQAAAQTVGIGQPNRLNGPELADEIVREAKAKYKTHANRDLVMKEVETSVAPLRDMGESANIVDVHNYRKSLDENINWSQKAQERDAVQNAYIDARNKVSDKTKQVIEGIDNSLGTEQTALLKKLNQRYSAAATVKNIAQQGAAREKARAFLGQGAIGVGAGGIAAAAEMNKSGDPLTALGKGVATSLAVTAARKYGTPIAYKGAQATGAVSRGIQAVSQRPGEIGTGLVSPWVQMNKDNKK
jgi:translation initiation factor 1 (eIF-1/SUI1)